MQKFKTVDELVSQLKPERPVYCIRKKPIHVASKIFQNKFHILIHNTQGILYMKFASFPKKGGGTTRFGLRIAD